MGRRERSGRTSRILFALVVGASFGEETVFRGYLFEVVRGQAGAEAERLAPR